MEGGVSAVTTAVGNLMTIAGTMLDTITANSFLVLFFAAGLVSIAIGIVRKLKRV